MHIHHLQHVEFEGLGLIKDWIKEKGHTLTTTRLFAGEILPAVDDIDWLIIMGGPMGVYEEQKYPWLIAEKQFIKQAIAAKKVLLGVCLGAQLIAEVLGAKVKPHICKEIGWHNINLLPVAYSSGLFKSMPATFPVFQWHGDSFELPPGSRKLASSECTINQAFIYERAVGLQFHLEVTPYVVQRFMCNCVEDLCEGPFIQKPEDIMGKPENFEQSKNFLNCLLSNMESYL